MTVGLANSAAHKLYCGQTFVIACDLWPWWSTFQSKINIKSIIESKSTICTVPCHDIISCYVQRNFKMYTNSKTPKW